MNAELNPLVCAIGYALVDFVWQGALIGLFTAALLLILRNHKPQLRYAIAGIALALCLALPLHTCWRYLATDHQALTAYNAAGKSGDTPISTADMSAIWIWTQAHLLQLVALWAICVVVFTSRLCLGLIWVARISSNHRSTVHPYWQTHLNQLAQRIGINYNVALRVVNDLTTPAVAGWLRPIVLVPAALISGMSPDLLEALLAHELAHIRRFDYVCNMLQSAVEILLFYHPAVWYISRQIRIEREQIADDLAAHMLGEPRRLALALSALDKFHYSQAQLTMTANGGNLMNRIKRLVRPEVKTTAWNSLIPTISLLFASMAFYAHAEVPAASATTETAPVKAIINFASCTKPEYPQQALKDKQQGMVSFAFSINTQGVITQSKIEKSSGYPLLDNAALTALNKCTFQPARNNGKAISTWAKVDYVWKLPS